MSIHVSWDSDEKAVIRLDFVGEWTWEEVEQAAQTAHQMKKNCMSPIGVIVDLTKSEHTPYGHILTHARNFASTASPNWSHTVVIVGANVLIEVISSKLHQIYPRFFKKTFLFASSIDEARQKLIEERQKL
jgi:hypothetical protein